MISCYGRRVMQLLKFRTRHSTRVYITLILVFITIFFTVSNITKFSPIDLSRPKIEVDDKADLLTVDISKQIKAQRDPYFDEFVSSKTFIKEKVLGFVSNLDLAKHKNLGKEDSKHDNKKVEDVDRFRVIDSYENLVTCDDLKYEHDLSFYVIEDKLASNLIEARREILSWDNEYSKKCKDDEKEKDLTEVEIVKKHWFEFGHMPLWLESQQCYVVYSRVLYTKGYKNWPEVSLIKATAYDKDWNEIRGKRIPYDDVKIPPNIEQELKDLDEQLGLVDCESSPDINNESEREECEITTNSNTLKIIKKREAILNNYFMTYPRIINLKVKSIPMFGGTEDPHVILRKDTNGLEEPIIIFNMDEGSGRRIYAYFPHRSIPSLVKFTMADGEDLGKMQKNWDPFFHREDERDYSDFSLGFIHFVRSVGSLHIVRCSLDDGLCITKFKEETKLTSKEVDNGDLRGGTQFIPLPDILPSVKGKNIWVGFFKTHTDECGCGPKFYRPILSVLIEVDGVYHVELMASGMDFTISPLNFKLDGTSCDGANVLTPNSISSWYVASQDTSKHSYEDYMTVTVSEADSLTKIVVIKGVLDYILNIYKDKAIKDTFVLNEEANSITGVTRTCVVGYGFEICRRYGLKHPAKDKNYKSS